MREKRNVFDRKTAKPEPPGFGLPCWGLPNEPDGLPKPEIVVDSPPPMPWVLHIVPGGGFPIEVPERPNLVRRLLQRLLLGWRYERNEFQESAPCETRSESKTRG